MKWTLLQVLALVVFGVLVLLIGCAARSADGDIADLGIWATADSVRATNEIRAMPLSFAEQTIEDARYCGYLEELIRKLAADGEICAVIGHQWRDGRPGEGEISAGSNLYSWYADYHPNTWYRTCKICGKCESKQLSEWE